MKLVRIDTARPNGDTINAGWHHRDGTATIRPAEVLPHPAAGADYFDDEGPASLVPLGIGRDVVLDRVIVDKSARIGNGARLVNRASVSHQDGPGYFIRNGIVVVPKDSTIPAGFEL